MEKTTTTEVTDTTGPREWLADQGKLDTLSIDQAGELDNSVHVVEASALTEANIKLKIAVDALEEAREYEEDQGHSVIADALDKLEGMN